MPLDKRTRERMLDYCGEVHAEDGADPRRLFASSPNERREGRKAKQLCRQVETALSYVLAGDGTDEVLQSLHVVSVAPAPNSSRLLVTVAVDGSGAARAALDRHTILDLLQRHAGRLRCEIAAAITRRRAPTLIFNAAVPSPSGARPPSPAGT